MGSREELRILNLQLRTSRDLSYLQFTHWVWSYGTENQDRHWRWRLNVDMLSRGDVEIKMYWPQNAPFDCSQWTVLLDTRLNVSTFYTYIKCSWPWPDNVPEVPLLKESCSHFSDAESPCGEGEILESVVLRQLSHYLDKTEQLELWCYCNHCFSTQCKTKREGGFLVWAFLMSSLMWLAT